MLVPDDIGTGVVAGDTAAFASMRMSTALLSYTASAEDDTSSRHLRNRRFWDEARRIQPGKILGWILSVEEHGARFKH